MSEKIAQIAERAATNVSRRQFLGRLGRGAAVLAGALGGFLALPGDAHAARQPCCCSATFGCYRRQGKCPRGVPCSGCC